MAKQRGEARAISREDILGETIRRILQSDPGHSIKDLAAKLKMNRAYLAGYLEALESRGAVRSKRIGPARVYFAVNRSE